MAAQTVHAHWRDPAVFVSLSSWTSPRRVRRAIFIDRARISAVLQIKGL
jgi:hypothetical protein